MNFFEPMSKSIFLTPDQRQQIEEMCAQGYIRAAYSEAHPSLTIYNYTLKTQFEHLWNDCTKMCRGLVVDDKNRIIIECPKKFFNENEPEAPDNSKWESTVFSEKLDGYYISFRYDHEYGLVVTSRGSFNNQYTTAARKLLPPIDQIVRDTDYFCELCQTFSGDEQIIVAKYDTPSLKLWGINNGLPDPSYNWHMPTAHYFSQSSLYEYLNEEVEGVVAFCPQTGERVKIKTDWYLEMHRAISNLSQKDTLNALIDDNPLSKKLDLPQEYMQKICEWEEEAITLFSLLETESLTLAKNTQFMSKKEIALFNGIGAKFKPVLFAIRDKKDYKSLIWRIVKAELLRNTTDQ